MTHLDRQADTHRRDRQNKAGGQRGTEESGPPKPSGHPEMEQKVVGGGEAEPRIGGDCGLVGVPG